MWGGSVQRDYIYIDDAVDAYIKLGELPEKLMDHNRIYNFGTGEVISVEQLIRKITKLSGNKFSIEKIEIERSDEIGLQYVSSQKASRILNWKPKYTLTDGLKNTLGWYKDYLKTTVVK
jgi:CDP-glucose 4,6-dehydratase